MVKFSFTVVIPHGEEENGTMRDEFEELLKKELRSLAVYTRDRLDLTQREMCGRLEMSESSYSDIETGKSACSALTAVLLLQLQPDPNACLLRIQEQFALAYEKKMQLV